MQGNEMIIEKRQDVKEHPMELWYVLKYVWRGPTHSPEPHGG